MTMSRYNSDAPAQALAHMNRGEWKKAESLLKGFLKKESHHADALHLMGMVQFYLGDGGHALEYLKRAIAVNGKDPGIHFHLALVQQGAGRLDDALQEYKTAITLNPGFVEAYNNMGNIFFHKGSDDTAMKCFSMALKLDPSCADACINLGNVFKKRGDFVSAETYYKKAVTLQPDAAEAYNNLGNIRLREEKLEEAAVFYQKAVELHPGYADAFNNYGSVFKKMGDYEKALEYYERAIQLAPTVPGPHMNRANILLLLGQFADGWREYEWRLQVKEGDLKQYRLTHGLEQPLWDGADAPEKRVLVYVEQGMGDAIQFIRFLPLLKRKVDTVIFMCRKALYGLFRGFPFPGIDKLVLFPSHERVGEAFDFEFDLHIPLLSLPGLLGLDENSFSCEGGPYLDVPSVLTEDWGKRIHAGDPSVIRIGLVWAGNPDHPNDRNRSCRLSLFGKLGEVRVEGMGFRFFSMQKGAGAEQVKDVPEALADVFFDVGGELGSFEDTAALMKNLDLVITVDTAVAHLAGALGCNVWILVPFDPDWRWMLDREDTPWYPTMRLFRQERAGEWTPVIERIKRDLQIFARNK